MAKLLYSLGSWVNSAGFVSSLLCLFMFYGSLVFRGEPRLSYAWFKWSLVAIFGGSLLTQIVLLRHPEFEAARQVELSATAKLVGDILSVGFYAALSAGALLIVDALHHPERGLGRYWPKVSQLFYAIYLFAERRSAEREDEDKEWPSVISVGSNI